MLQRYWQRVRFEPRTLKSLGMRAEIEQELMVVRNNGYAVVDEEVELGLRTIAVPIRSDVSQYSTRGGTSAWAWRPTMPKP